MCLISSRLWFFYRLHRLILFCSPFSPFSATVISPAVALSGSAGAVRFLASNGRSSLTAIHRRRISSVRIEVRETGDGWAGGQIRLREGAGITDAEGGRLQVPPVVLFPPPPFPPLPFSRCGCEVRFRLLLNGWADLGGREFGGCFPSAASPGTGWRLAWRWRLEKGVESNRKRGLDGHRPRPIS